MTQSNDEIIFQFLCSLRKCHDFIQVKTYQIIVITINIVSQIYKTAYCQEKLSENVLMMKFDSKRCDIFTKTQKLGRLTAVFRSFPFKNKIGDIFG